MEDVTHINMDPIEINFNDTNNLNTNFGGGIELLMNDKNKSSGKSTIDVNDLDKLEDDLNDLSTIDLNKNNFNFTPHNDTPMKVQFDDGNNDSKLGASTTSSIGNSSTWDGFVKFNDSTTTSEKTSNPTFSNLSERDKKRKKRSMLKALNDWQERGFLKDGSRFNNDSSFEDIEDEYESALEDKRKRDSVKIQQNWMITMINTIEYGNSMFDPFGVNLDGWGEAISEDVESYEEIFGELYEKYKGGKMSPELSLLLRLGFSASVVHFSNKALSTATPGFNDVIKQSPELMKMFTSATVESMKNTSPGMAFAEELLNTKPNTSSGPPPSAVDTRDFPPPTRPGAMNFTPAPSTRPDIAAGRGAEAMSTMFKESGVELDSGVSSINVQEKSIRPEMNGPRNTDIDNILSGLKKKNDPNSIQEIPASDIINDTDSIISISSLNDSNNPPKRGRPKRNRSDKKVVSLDI